MKKLKTILLASVLVFTASSCTFIDATPENVVSSEENNATRSALYANFTGLFTLLQDVADDLIFVSELRGDLLQPTSQAPAEFQDIHTATATAANNALVDPAKYYRIIMNTNDFLRNAVQYNADYPGIIPTTTYRQMIGGAVCLRTWAYLTLGKLYGGAAYYDYAMTGEIDLSKVEYYDFDRLINELVYFMQTGVDRINGLVRVNFADMFGIEGDEWQKVSIQPDILLTELFLWQKDYQNAAKRGINAITGTGVLDGADGTDGSVNDRYTLNSSWSNIYGSKDLQAGEGLTCVFYDRNKNQINDLQAFFQHDRDYYLAPTSNYEDLFRYTTAMKNKDNYWEGDIVDMYGFQRLRNSVAVVSSSNISATYRVNKFSLNSNAINDNTIYLYRAGELYLMIAEALAHINRFEAADSLINAGTNNAGNFGGYAYPFNTPIWNVRKTAKIQGVRRRAGEVNVDGNSIIIIGGIGFISSGSNYPQVSVDFLSPELRALAAMTEEERLADPLYDEYQNKRSYVLDSIIADETARELAFEGKRWFTLLRMARNSNKPDILAVPVSKKYSDENQASMLFHFRQEENWFFDDGIKK